VVYSGPRNNALRQAHSAAQQRHRNTPPATGYTGDKRGGAHNLSVTSIDTPAPTACTFPQFKQKVLG